MAGKGGLLSAIKQDVEKTGSNRGKFFYVKSGTKARIRFLEDADEGRKIHFHDRWDPALKVPCRKNRDEDADCPYCGLEGVRNRDMYAWSVWDYDANEVKIFMYPANQCSPVPGLVALYDTYGNIIDRDFSVSRSGQGTNTSYTLVGLDKTKFRNEKAKPVSDKEFWKALLASYPEPDTLPISDDGEDEDEVAPKKKAKTEVKKAKVSKFDYGNLDDEADEDDYENMTAKELYALCKDRGIKVEVRKSEGFYKKKLQEWDEENLDAEDEDDDFWGED